MKKITVYTKNNCAQCKMTKKKLDDLGIAYELINVDEDEKERDYVKDVLGFRTMPVVVADGLEPFAGFQPDKINKLKESK